MKKKYRDINCTDKKSAYFMCKEKVDNNYNKRKRNITMHKAKETLIKSHESVIRTTHNVQDSQLAQKCTRVTA